MIWHLLKNVLNTGYQEQGKILTPCILLLPLQLVSCGKAWLFLTLFLHSLMSSKSSSHFLFPLISSNTQTLHLLLPSICIWHTLLNHSSPYPISPCPPEHSYFHYHQPTDSIYYNKLKGAFINKKIQSPRHIKRKYKKNNWSYYYDPTFFIKFQSSELYAPNNNLNAIQYLFLYRTTKKKIIQNRNDKIIINKENLTCYK